MGKPPPSRLQTLHLLGSLLLIFFLLGILVAAELLLRHARLSASAEPRDHVVATAYMPIKLKPNYRGVFWGVAFETDLRGFRSEHRPAAASFSDERAQILALGDSVGFGLGIPAAEHYTQVMQEELNRVGTIPFQVINAGGQGYSPSSYQVYLRHEGIGLEPRWVLIEIELCNDVTDEALLHWEIDPADPQTLAAVRGGRYQVGWDGNLLATYAVGDYFFEKTYLYTELLRRTLDLLYRIAPTEPFVHQQERGVCYYHLGFDRYLLDRERIESGWQKLFQSLKATHRLLRSSDIRFLLLVLPSRSLFQEDDPSGQAFAGHILERALSEAHEAGLPVLNLAPALEQGGGSDLYFDFVHLNKTGNRVVGRALAEHFLERSNAGRPKESAPLR